VLGKRERSVSSDPSFRLGRFVRQFGVWLAVVEADPDACREFLWVAQWQTRTLGVGEQSPGWWLVRGQCAYLLRVPDGQIETNESATTTAEYITPVLCKVVASRR